MFKKQLSKTELECLDRLLTSAKDHLLLAFTPEDNEEDQSKETGINNNYSLCNIHMRAVLNWQENEDELITLFPEFSELIRSYYYSDFKANLDKTFFYRHWDLNFTEDVQSFLSDLSEIKPDLIRSPKAEYKKEQLKKNTEQN